jgi:chromosome segregation protein
MRLKHIKLSGFKSFVDSTTVAFPSAMSAVVGPNGCGKSNVIDAVRWVLGESSARNLRGDAMTDVIFNGAAQRKPVSQAMVELLFSNTQGRLQGSLADRSEIAIKRVVTRDGQSHYFLNGSKCRRRDITDVFLGTGLGPRSYAIIEQGMISRLIESKPHELRVFLEEAAGISRYKERRRETELRMQHTRDNLVRLNDVREELGRQLSKLQRQVSTAKRYTELKAQERQLQHELLVLQWQADAAQLQQVQQQATHCQLHLDAMGTEQTQALRQQTVLQNQLEQAKRQLHDTTQQFYLLSNDITRLDQQHQHAQQQQRQLQQQLQQLEQEYTELSHQCHTGALELTALTKSLDEAEQAESLQLAQAEQSAEALAQEQQQLHTLQQHIHRIEQLELQQRQQWHSMQQQVQRAQAAVLQCQTQQQQWREQLRSLDMPTAEAALCSAQATLADTQEQLSASEITWRTEQQQLAEQRLAQQELQLQWHRDELELQHLQKQISSLRLAHQEAAAALPLLAEPSIPPRWATAIAVVLGGLSAAKVLTEAPSHSMLSSIPTDFANSCDEAHQAKRDPQIAAMTCTAMTSTAMTATDYAWVWPHGQDSSSAMGDVLGYVAPNAIDVPPHSPTIDLPTLAQLCPGHYWPDYFATVFAAPTDAQARLWQPHLAIGQSIITPDGTWFGVNWQLAPRPANNALPAQIATQLAEVEAQAAAITQRMQVTETSLTQLSQALQQSVAMQDRLELQHQSARSAHQQAMTAVEVAHTTLTQRGLQQQQWAAQLRQVEQQLPALELALSQAQAQLEQLSELDADTSDEKMQLQQQRDRRQHAVQTAQLQWQHQQQQLQHATHARAELQRRQHTLQLTFNQAQIRQGQCQQQLHALRANADALAEQAQPELQLKLSQLLQAQQQAERAKQAAAAEEDALSAALRQCTHDIQHHQQKIEPLLQQQQRLVQQIAALEAQLRQYQQQLQQAGADINALHAGLASTADIGTWQQRLTQTSAAVAALGAVNLAALDEFAQLQQREQYLQQQHDDLAAALSTLESAIRKIDRETRQTFRQTFDAVNADLQDLFPKVFGGGSAALELTGDDVLEAGVTIMAQPPGKKNSTIHLLSGGEKALTALSLVFSIFRLNPAPFCLLDEVDAPLDDANVGRFCNLVREMSQRVQFVYISHNKIAMEMATQLIGVTMQEPGVSRIVAVDVEDAVKLANA